MANPSTLRMLLAATGAIRPPALLEAGFPELDLEGGGYPPGSVGVEIASGSSATLRGVYVPSDEGASIVLHLLESEGSVTFGARDLFGYRVLQELQDLGFASLMVDYRGIGASEGKRDPGNVPTDARLMWQEALQRAGGDSSRILVRGMSFGCLAAARLLAEGLEPGAVILVAPPRAETIIQNWTRENFPWLASLTAFARQPVAVDVVRELQRIRCPLLVYAPHQDYILTPPERFQMQQAVAQAGGVWRPTPLSHAACVLDAHHVVPAERALLARLRPARPPVATRVQLALDAMPQRVVRLFPEGSRLAQILQTVVRQWLPRPAALAGALALAHVHGAPVGQTLHWLRRLRPDRLEPLPFEALAALTDLEDPAGRIRPQSILELAEYLAELPGGPPSDPGVLARLARELGFHRGAAPPVFRGPTGWQHATPAEGFALYRRKLRALLKAAGIPERLRLGGGLEVWREGRWEPFGGGGSAVGGAGATRVAQ